jgi:hypothetical protein
LSSDELEEKRKESTETITNIRSQLEYEKKAVAEARKRGILKFVTSRQTTIDQLETTLDDEETKLDGIEKLSTDITYAWNRYGDENIDEESFINKNDDTSQSFGSTLDDDKYVVRRQLCIDIITFTSTKPLNLSIEQPAPMVYLQLSVYCFAFLCS